MAVAVISATVTAALAAAGHVLTVSREARGEVLSLPGLERTPGLGWFARSDDGMIPRTRVAALSWSLPATDAAQSVTTDLVTGSLGDSAALLRAPAAAPTARFSLAPAEQDDVRPQPVPRARPKLAALPSPGEAGIQLEEDALMARTAIYDISAKTVYMPNGERLEAHSGYGPYMDDPRYTRLKMRGATPPNIYKLRLREALFHGVQAIRMTPENEREMYGRDGILAHSYLLGPNGQSHGCVSFKDYPKFLKAFLRGEVERMVVVTKLDTPPAFARRATKSASAGVNLAR